MKREEFLAKYNEMVNEMSSEDINEMCYYAADSNGDDYNGSLSREEMISYIMKDAEKASESFSEEEMIDVLEQMVQHK